MVDLGLIGAGVFVTDPLLGYPLGAPATTTLNGTLHTAWSTAVFLALPSACVLLARRFAADRR